MHHRGAYKDSQISWRHSNFYLLSCMDCEFFLCASERIVRKYSKIFLPITFYFVYAIRWLGVHEI